MFKKSLLKIFIATYKKQIKTNIILKGMKINCSNLLLPRLRNQQVVRNQKCKARLFTLSTKAAKIRTVPIKGLKMEEFMIARLI